MTARNLGFSCYQSRTLNARNLRTSEGGLGIMIGIDTFKNEIESDTFSFLLLIVCEFKAVFQKKSCPVDSGHF